VLILCGLIASGKSTFAEALQQHFPLFRRCNQDDLGDRRRVEQLARDTLAQGQSACIDRTNFNAAQRSYWIEIANEFPQIAIWVIVFDTPYEVCAERLRTRQNHPTITSVELGLDVLSRFSADFEQPYPNEGYHRIIRLKPEETFVTYSRSDVAAILRKVQYS
ncbi:AAA domain-containing protein, partial [Crepidotus variabilis]